MPNFLFRPRGYIHFDTPMNREAAERLATTPASVTAHSFYPFIYSVQKTQKIARDDQDRVHLMPEKTRSIAYAAHGDSHIYSHYADILSERYEAILAERGIHQCVTAFRKLNGRRNIHFADEVFEFIRQTPSCSALALDVSDFFGSLDHSHLRVAWSSLMQVTRLPADHFAVFKAITRFCQVERNALFNALHVPINNPHSTGNHRLPHLDQHRHATIPDNTNRLCSPSRFRVWVRERGLLQINGAGRGIPQGSPISAVLSNIYMLEMDTEMNAYAAANGGLYRRYCDDILVVMPTVELREQAFQMIEAWRIRLNLNAFNPDKTERIEFGPDRPITGKPLQYLGFTFDGRHKRIRPASVARYYRKMRKGVLRTKIQRAKADQEAGRNGPSPLKKKRLYRHYTYLGQKLGNNKEERRNFLSYVFDAARIMNEPSIKKQVKAHWSKLQDEIEKPLPPPPPPRHLRVHIRKVRNDRARLNCAMDTRVQ